MFVDQFFSKFFVGDCQKFDILRIDEDLIIEGTSQFKRIEPFINFISFSDPTNHLILKTVNLKNLKIDNPSIILEFNNYISINYLDISNINVRSVFFVNCKLLPPDFVISFDNIVFDNSELIGTMSIKTKSITFLNNIIIQGKVKISSPIVNILYPIQILNDNKNYCSGGLFISSY